MATVAALRNEIRVAVGRYEREVSSGFTKEALAAICESLDADIETEQIPGKGEMRAAIADEVDSVDSTRESSDGFRKAELQAIASALSSE